MRRRRSSIGWGWLCAALLIACGKSYNEGLLDKAPSQMHDGHAGSGASDASAPHNDAGDASAPNGSGGHASTGSGGSGMSMGTGGVGGMQGECVLDPIDATCKLRCPETCNNEDDDCDGKIDEDAQAGCKADHATASCITGECRIAACTDGYRDCNDNPDDGCEIAPDDVLNCGSCGHACDLLNAIASCQKDKCVAIGCDGVYDDCDKNKNDCETAANTLKNCGKCGLTCSDADVANASASCERGFCGVGECYMGYGDCNQTPGDGCEQTLATNAHCGACNKPCDLKGSDDDCGTGVCLAQSCTSGYDNCDGNPANGCESLGTDGNCGGCGKTCDGTLANVASAQCKSQACELHCAALYADCDDDPGTGCETPINTPERCSACDKPCAIKNAEVTCETGTCTFVRCNQGWGDCNSDLSPDDGCETPLDTLQHCATCNQTCNKASCSGGVCTAADCTMPPHDDDCGGSGNCGNCDGNDADCEANLNGDTNNCSTCGHKCVFNSGVNMPNATLSCANAACKANCSTGFDDCNQNYRDGCETPLNTLQNCGSCGTGCAIANATPTCSTRSCQVQTCTSDYADCNNDKTSCETQLGTTANCTGCGQACALANAVPSCTGSAGAHSCAISSCTQSYYADCDGTPGNGCEIDKRSSTANCGNCGNNCAMHAHVQSASCGSGVCSYACASGFGNCTSAAGCETPLTTLTDCASCGTTCARANGTASCSTGSCQLSGCNSGYQNCDGNAGNGCEPLTTLQNCGGCNQPCSVVNGSATCATQTCQIDSCNTDWDDCDLSPTNGCERNIKPPASGGLGPCLPDANCTHQTYSGRDYYVCTTDRSWSDARAHCQLQLLGDLVHIDDSGENAFVLGAIAADAWVGGSDSAVEGRWRWANDDVQFWMGAASGTGTGYTNWTSGEPNDSNGNEDCMQMYKTTSAGKWNDQTCTDVRDFVCEVQPDLCPSDPNKANPGQCGCGTPDTDSDGDMTADCNDGCPNDASKVAAGQCGCGNADTDNDTDGTANCNDGCPDDMNKVAAGQCGCGTADTDSDGDGTANCNDACPFDDTRTSAPCAFSYTPTNFDQTTLNFGSAPTTVLDCSATTTVDTSTTPATFTNWCGTPPTPVVQSQSGGPDVVILPLQGFTLAATRTLRVIGTRPLVLAVRGDVTINGTINARGVGATPGAGGNQSCASAGNGGNGQSDSGGDSGGGGGGGAGFGAAGQTGGRGNAGYSNGGNGGGAGAAAGAAALSPLRGGCKGGNGGNGNGTGGSGGGGGGAFQISGSGTLTLGSSAIVSASGGGGLPGNNDEDGGGGGGSGGGIFLEASTVSIASGAWVSTNGGAGAGGNETDSANGGPGTDGFANNNARAPGGPADQGGGGGGDGGASAGGATAGGNGVMKYVFFGGGGGGGGAGGGVGRIRIHGVTSCAISGNFSPSASQACP